MKLFVKETLGGPFSVDGIDGIGLESLMDELEHYKYKDELEIPAPGIVDDILTISEIGYKTARLNSFIDAKIAMKKLQLGPKNVLFFILEKSMKTLSCLWMAGQ